MELYNSIKQDEFGKSLDLFNEYINSNKDNIKTKLESALDFYDKEFTNTIVLLDALKKMLIFNKDMKYQLQLFMDGTFKNINICINTELNIIVNIEAIVDESLESLLNKNIISYKIYDKEKQWRNIMKNYPSNESKLEYMKVICKNIEMYEVEINNSINKIHIINMLKLKIYNTKYRNIQYDYLNDIKNKYQNFSEETINTEHVHEKPQIKTEHVPEKVSTNIEHVPEKPQIKTEHVPEKVSTTNNIISNNELLEPPCKKQKTLVDTRRPYTPPLPHNAPANSYYHHLSDKYQYYSNKSTDNTQRDTVPFDIYLENYCKYGSKCMYINNSRRCSFNHILLNKNNKIYKGDYIPHELCHNERPWMKLRCKDLYCNKLHCVGRVNYVKEFHTNN